jgi:hypothetical protein
VIEWLPALSEATVRVAVEGLEELSREAVPKVVAPSRKVTVPVGLPLVTAATVAVNVTLVP